MVKKSANNKRGFKKIPEYSLQVDLKDYADSEGYEPGFVTGKIMSDKRLVIYITDNLLICVSRTLACLFLLSVCERIRLTPILTSHSPSLNAGLDVVTDSTVWKTDVEIARFQMVGLWARFFY